MPNNPSVSDNPFAPPAPADDVNPFAAPADTEENPFATAPESPGIFDRIRKYMNDQQKQPDVLLQHGFGDVVDPISQGAEAVGVADVRRRAAQNLTMAHPERQASGVEATPAEINAEVARINTADETPLINLPQVGQVPGIPGLPSAYNPLTYAAAVHNAVVAPTVRGLSTPNSLAMLAAFGGAGQVAGSVPAAAGIAKTAMTAGEAYFGSQMAQDVAQKYQAAQKVLNDPDSTAQERAEALLAPAPSALMAGSIGAHLGSEALPTSTQSAAKARNDARAAGFEAHPGAPEVECTASVSQGHVEHPVGGSRDQYYGKPRRHGCGACPHCSAGGNGRARRPGSD